MLIKIFFIIAYGFLACMMVSFFFGLKYRNPYKLIMVFGKKGTGKTTLLVKLAYQWSKKGHKVYSTAEGIPNTYHFDVDDLGKYKFDENSLVLIDEVSLIWSNRDFKSFRKEVEAFFRLQRHYKLTVYLFSQSFDIDKKIRDLTDEMYLSTCLLNCIGYMKGISKIVVLTKSDSSNASSIAENLQFKPFILFFLGTRKITFLPRWAGMFDSFETPDQPPIWAEYSGDASPKRMRMPQLRFRFRLPPFLLSSLARLRGGNKR